MFIKFLQNLQDSFKKIPERISKILSSFRKPKKKIHATYLYVAPDEKIPDDSKSEISSLTSSGKESEKFNYVFRKTQAQLNENSNRLDAQKRRDDKFFDDSNARWDAISEKIESQQRIMLSTIIRHFVDNGTMNIPEGEDGARMREVLFGTAGESKSLSI